MTLNASGNLSIGNTNNNFRLEVTGEGRFYQSATTSSAYLRVENNRARNAAVRLTTTVGDYYLGVGIGADVNQFQIFDGNAGATRFTIASTGAATFSSSVTAGASSLFNAGTGALSADILTVRGGGGSGTFGFKVEANNGEDIFYTDNFTYNIIANPVGGKFGIGTTSPFSLLQVTSGTSMTTTGGDQASNATIEGANVAIGANFTSQLAVLTNSSIAADSGGGIAFGSKYSGNAFAYYAAIKTGKDDATSGNFGGYLQFATRANGGNVTERMRITSGGAVQIQQTIQTGAPANGTAQPWKLGNAVSGTVSPSHYLVVEINGQSYTINAFNGFP
jgi:hypothetical protein